ncbi:Glycerol-3-phosphate acyltransferase, chloroplastic [Tetrabaena socialis]|uniref:Glycerol-3-phosphate acyltransferase, chloroplastic n=1 Tax=Tetrabaena socialis TaxID=47790 RepID=A0A2J7ZPX5_9CHLO|nr:Glycerol-3-phosphate acyltransferase, chloroplastic [Tetrabaena socialis]|eukprot:PNH02302.1 Glycerol-3-phosphate acyltransferase, chloroplastic [Tetrabaena socialis]
MLHSTQRAAHASQRRPLATGRRGIVAHVAAPAAVSPSPTTTTTPSSAPVQFHQAKLAAVESEQQFKMVIKGLVASGKMPAELEPAWEFFYDNYKKALLNSGVSGVDEKWVTTVQATILDNVLLQAVQPYTFPSFHTRIMEPYNYYDFGQRYVATLIDFKNSVLGHRERWDRVQALLEQKHNVVLLANHQTEADPGVFAHMLASSHPTLATDVIYVAGDRVVTDAMCKPFSMGRNLFCVHSKKHMDFAPELKASKMETNRRTLVAMQRKLNEGGTLLWIAPSGGRDRPNADDEWLPDVFDPTAVELMRSLTQRAKQPGHIIPMSMFSYPMMPPPKTLEKNVGERRMTAFTGVGIDLCEELDIPAIIGGLAEKEAQQRALATAAHTAVKASYVDLTKAITDPAFRASSPAFSQPWAQSA